MKYPIDQLVICRLAKLVSVETVQEIDTPKRLKGVYRKENRIRILLWQKDNEFKNPITRRTYPTDMFKARINSKFVCRIGKKLSESEFVDLTEEEEEKKMISLRRVKSLEEELNANWGCSWLL